MEAPSLKEVVEQEWNNRIVIRYKNGMKQRFNFDSFTDYMIVNNTGIFLNKINGEYSFLPFAAPTQQYWM